MVFSTERSIKPITCICCSFDTWHNRKGQDISNAFIDSQFNYAPLLWMFCKKTLYLKIEKIHHKTLKVIYESNDKLARSLYNKDILDF